MDFAIPSSSYIYSFSQTAGCLTYKQHSITKCIQIFRYYRIIKGLLSLRFHLRGQPSRSCTPAASPSFTLSPCSTNHMCSHAAAAAAVVLSWLCPHHGAYCTHTFELGEALNYRRLESIWQCNSQPDNSQHVARRSVLSRP